MLNYNYNTFPPFFVHIPFILDSFIFPSYFLPSMLSSFPPFFLPSPSFFLAFFRLLSYLTLLVRNYTYTAVHEISQNTYTAVYEIFQVKRGQQCRVPESGMPRQRHPMYPQPHEVYPVATRLSAH